MYRNFENLNKPSIFFLFKQNMKRMSTSPSCRATGENNGIIIKDFHVVLKRTFCSFDFGISGFENMFDLV